MVRACIVVSYTSGVQVPSHQFPKDTAISELWVKAVKADITRSRILN